MDLMRRTTRRVFTGLVAVLVAGGLAACQDAGAPLQPDGLQSTDADAAARGGGPPSGTPGNASAKCDVTVPDDESTIQGGVDAAAAGATVCVEGSEGPYREQVVINKDLTLRGLDGPTIETPDDPDDFIIPESGPTWEPIVFAYGGTASGVNVSGSGTVEVTVRGFTVDGRSTQPNVPRKVGIFYRNAHGTVEGNTVENMGVGGKETMGILAYGDSHVAITGNTVSDYERGGIGANGDGGAHPSPQVRIVSNDVTGSTGIGEAWGPNGIQVGYGASGQIRNNVVQDNRYSESTATASCVLVFESDDVRIQGNELTNCDAAVGVGTVGFLRASADNIKIQRNQIDDALFGIFLEAFAYPSLIPETSVSNVKIVNNSIFGKGSDDTAGIRIETTDYVGSTASADNNKLINNQISGFTTAVADGGTATKQAANAFSP